MDFDKPLDEVDIKLLIELQKNPRVTFSELGRRVGMTQPAVAERVRRLEESGVITGYRVDLNLEKLGLPILAFIRVATPDDVKGHQLVAWSDGVPEVLECHRITGDDSYVLKIGVKSVQHLERFITRLIVYGQPTTSIILSSPISRKVVEPPAPAHHGQSSSARDSAREEPHLTR